MSANANELIIALIAGGKRQSNLPCHFDAYLSAWRSLWEEILCLHILVHTLSCPRHRRYRAFRSTQITLPLPSINFACSPQRKSVLQHWHVSQSLMKDVRNDALPGRDFLLKMTMPGRRTIISILMRRWFVETAPRVFSLVCMHRLSWCTCSPFRSESLRASVCGWSRSCRAPPESAAWARAYRTQSLSSSVTHQI